MGEDRARNCYLLIFPSAHSTVDTTNSLIGLYKTPCPSPIFKGVDFVLRKYWESFGIKFNLQEAALRRHYKRVYPQYKKTMFVMLL